MNRPLHHLAALTALAFALGAAAPIACAQTSPKIVKKVPPEFPREAARKGVDKGVLKAKLTVDGNGVPTAVEIVDAQPAKAKVLNESVIEALNLWRFEAPGKPTTFELQIVLTSD
jgi:TonB family protein